MRFQFPRIAKLFLAGFLAVGAATTAGAAPLVFNFDEPNSCSEDDPYEYECFEPSFVEEDGEDSVFELTHQAGVEDAGRVKWIEASGMGSSFESGHLKLTTEYSEYGTPISSTMYFSKDVSSIGMLYKYTDIEGSGVDLIPLLAGGGEGTPVHLGYTPPTEDAEDRYVPIPTITGGPYEGIRIVTQWGGYFRWTQLTVDTVSSGDPDHPRAVPVTVAPDQTLIDVPGFKAQANNVVKGGTAEADFCVARDLREQKKPNGTFVYTPRSLKLKEATGGTPPGTISKGTCTGPIPPTMVGSEEITTWEALLAKVNLEIPAWSRSLKGTFNGVNNYWFVIGIVRTSAEFDGVIGVLPFPEKLITYDSSYLQANGELKCDSSNVAQRPLTFSGAVPAFGDFANVEGNRMIPDTAQCDGQLSLTRRTTHAYPMRIDAALLPEALNIETQIAGLAATLTQAYNCVNVAQRLSITQMRTQLVAAQLALLLRRYGPAVIAFEQIARIARGASFNSCGTEMLPSSSPRSNYKGTFMARALTASFTVWDRFIYRTVPWVQYLIPANLEADIPYSNLPKIE